MSIDYIKLQDTNLFELVNLKNENNNKFFKPHRHQFYELIWITKGSGTHSIDFKKYELKKDRIFFIAPSLVHEWLDKEYKKQYEGYIFLFNKTFLEDNKIANEFFNNHNISPYVDINPHIKESLQKLMELIKKEYKNKDIPLLQSLCKVFFGYLHNTKHKYTLSSYDKRVSSLLELVENNYKKEKYTHFYAQKLQLTPKRVNELTKKYLNMSLSELILDKVLTEAKRLLVFSDLSSKDISEELGFLEPSYFSRLFKKQTKLSPLDFRKKIQKL